MEKGREKRGNANIPKLDLHGLYPDEALNRVDVFLYDRYKKKLASSEIVYGIGGGVLRKKVLEFLKEHPLVSKIEEEAGRCKIILDI